MLCSMMLTLTSPSGDSQETDLQGFKNASGHGESASGRLHPHYTTCLGGCSRITGAAGHSWRTSHGAREQERVSARGDRSALLMALESS